MALADLKPLKYCLYTIRYEFLRFAQFNELMSDFAMSTLSRDLGAALAPKDAIESADTEVHANSSSKSPKVEIPFQAPLETFFPFDPCYLISLHQYIDKYYRPWRGIPGANGDGSTADVSSHVDEEESSSYFMSTADGKQHNLSASVASSNMSSTASNTFFNREYGMSGLSNVTFSMYSRSLNDSAEMAISVSKSANLTSAMSEGAEHESLNTFMSNQLATRRDPGVGLPRDEGPTKSTPMRRPRQYSISSTGSW